MMDLGDLHPPIHPSVDDDLPGTAIPSRTTERKEDPWENGRRRASHSAQRRHWRARQVTIWSLGRRACGGGDGTRRGGESRPPRAQLIRNTNGFREQGE